MNASRIQVDGGVHFGKPCVSGSRIPVDAILELIEAGISFSEVIRDYYPDLTIEDVRACVRYALDLVRSEEVHLVSAPVA